MFGKNLSIHINTIKLTWHEIGFAMLSMGQRKRERENK